jgi:hypothetical protein
MPRCEISRIFVKSALAISDNYDFYPSRDPVRPFIPAMWEILHQVGKIEFAIFINFALSVQFVLHAGHWFRS